MDDDDEDIDLEAELEQALEEEDEEEDRAGNVAAADEAAAAPQPPAASAAAPPPPPPPPKPRTAAESADALAVASALDDAERQRQEKARLKEQRKRQREERDREQDEARRRFQEELDQREREHDHQGPEAGGAGDNAGEETTPAERAAAAARAAAGARNRAVAALLTDEQLDRYEAFRRAAVARSGVRPRTFTVGFDGASMLDERADAAAVARHVGAEHTEISVRGDAAGDVLDRVFAGLDEPFADASAVPTFLVSEATARKVKVVLTGDGADEIFAGYRRYWGEVWAGTWGRVPSPLRAGIARAVEALPEGKESWLLESARRARRFIASAHADPVARQAAWMRECDADELDRLLGPTASTHCLDDLLTRARATSPTTDPVSAMLAADVGVLLPGDMLVKVDRMSMANALETRAPFLDQRVVECAFALPGAMKLSRKGLGAEGKRILRTAFRDRLPAEVFTRRKRGFEMPVRDLLLGPAAERLAAACDPARLARQGLFSADVVAGWRRDLDERRRDTSWRLWTMLAFQEWARLHRRPEAL